MNFKYLFSSIIPKFAKNPLRISSFFLSQKTSFKAYETTENYQIMSVCVVAI